MGVQIGLNPIEKILTTFLKTKTRDEVQKFEFQKTVNYQNCSKYKNYFENGKALLIIGYAPDSLV